MTKSKPAYPFYLSAIAISSYILFSSCPVSADYRSDASLLIAQLRESLPQQRAEEMRSITDAYMTAEHYFQKQELELAERYYLLATQKGRILKTALEAEHAPAPVPTPASPQPPEQPGTVPTTPAEIATDPSPPRVPSLTAEPSPDLATGAAPPQRGEDEQRSELLIGNTSTYSVRKNETLRLIAAKLGVNRYQLARMNKLDMKARLKVGQKLRYNNRKIIPQRMKTGIVVNIPDRTLYYFKDGKLIVSVPVALGVPQKNKKYDWTTPIGRFKVVAKQKDPTWYVPPSIQSEMEDEGKEVITSIPPGPTNPLGKYAIKTSLPGIMIHSTIKPGSIYSFASHGCIRIYPEHMEDFFKEVKVNTPGEIIYRPVKLAVTESGRVFLEVHNDIYDKKIVLRNEAKRLIEKHKLSDQVDWKKVEMVIKNKAGIAEDVTFSEAMVSSIN